MFGKTKKKVLVACCSNRNPEWPTVLAIQDAMRHTAKNGADLVFKPRVGESLICRARQNDLVEFIQRGFDAIVWFDDDVVIPNTAISDLLQADRDIVAGVYRLKQDEPAAAVRLPLEGDGPDWNRVLHEGLLTRATYVSTGCFMVKREVIQGMIEAHPKQKYHRNVKGDEAWALFQPYVYKDEYLSEDWAFCQRALDAGFEVWVHGGVKCDHWGKRVFRFGEM
jgi:hypothetical protein